MEELPEETEIINKKNDFYQAENELMEKAFEAYKKIKEYTDLGITENEIKNTRESMEKYEGDYKKIHKKKFLFLPNLCIRQKRKRNSCQGLQAFENQNLLSFKLQVYFLSGFNPKRVFGKHLLHLRESSV